MGDHWGTGSVASNSFCLIFSLLPLLTCLLASTKRGEGSLLLVQRDRSIAPSIGVGKFEAGGDVERQPMDG